jgi:FdhE protein
MGLPSWDERIKRAEELADSYPFARDPLRFYRDILIFQKDLYIYLSQSFGKLDADQNGSCPLHGGSISWHLPLLLTFFPSFLSLVKRIGPPQLSQLADELLVEIDENQIGSLLESYWRKELDAEDSQVALIFFPKAFLQPYAEFLANNHTLGDEWEVAEGASALCPLCASRPQLSILETEGEGAKRLLLCSVCSTQWRFKRVCCPACGEEQFSKLAYHTASDFPHLRVETCESCHKYIKCVDLTAHGLAVPVVDEIAAIPLDIWAREQGYKKLEMNLVGI